MSEHADSAAGCWDLSKRTCLSCEGDYRDIVDGLCRGCRGETTYSPEVVQAAKQAILGWKSEKTLREEAWAEEYLSRHRETRREWARKQHDTRRPA